MFIVYIQISIGILGCNVKCLCLGSNLKVWKTTKTLTSLFYGWENRPESESWLLQIIASHQWAPGGHSHRHAPKAGLILPGRGVVTQRHRATEVRDQVPSLWSQYPFAPHKCNQPYLEQNGFNQLRHPHSPGSGATKRLGSCPQRTVRLMCLSTLQGQG